jgi:hypothetical protein
MFLEIKECAYDSASGICSAYCLIERQNPFPGEGVKSVFSMGFGAGMYETILTALEIPYESIPPQEWQKAARIYGKGKGKAIKAYSHMVASRLFPSIQLTTPRGRKLDGRADALLIARYAQAGRRNRFEKL